MAGDWIKMRTNLGSERATMIICDLTGLDEFAVVGRLHAIWVWAGEHTVTGDVTGVTLKTIDRVSRCENFGESMVAAGWLEVMPDGGVRFPKWKKHNSKAAKERALAAARQAKKRAKSHALKRDVDRDMTVTNHAPRAEAEQSRVEEITASANALCMDRGVQGGKGNGPKMDRRFASTPVPREFMPALDAMLGILSVDDPDQFGFLAKLAYAHAVGFEFVKPVWDYIGRARKKSNKAGYLTSAIRDDLGPERWLEFLESIPSPAHCQWILSQAGREAVRPDRGS